MSAISMRQNAARLGFDLQPIGLKEFSDGYKCDPSLAAACALPERVDFSDSVDSSTDVDGSYTLSLWSSGRCELSADFRDSGILAGDNYAFVLTFRLPGDPVAKAISHEGYVGPKGADDNRDRWVEARFDPSFVNNWAAVVRREVEIRWHIETSVSVGDVLRAIFQGGVVIALLAAGGSGKGQWSKDEDGNIRYTAPLTD